MAISINKSDMLTSVLVEVTGSDGGVEMLATMLDRDGQLHDRGMLVWSAQRESSDGALRLLGSAGSEWSLNADLSRVSGAVVEIALCLTVDAHRRDDGNGVAVRIVDRTRNRTLAHIPAKLSVHAAVREIGRLARSGASWRFVETGRDYVDGVDAMLRRSGLAGETIAAAGTRTLDAQFLAIIGENHPAGYCDATERLALVGQGKRLGMDAETAETMLDLELARRGIVNETALLARLDAVLRRFTDKDRRLDDKERHDALQFVCKPEHGFAQGLRHDVADPYVTRFCRERGVKVRIGLLRWAVP